MKKLLLLISFFSILLIFSCSNDKKAEVIDKKNDKDTVQNVQHSNSKAIVTFVELGSVNCVPCKQMQPIMASLEKKYGEQLEVIFYDVVKKEHKDKSKEFGIRLIPTQVFLDKNGKEIHRHEGFYPEAEIEKFLQEQGLKPI